MRPLKFLLSPSLLRGLLPLLGIACVLLTPQLARCADDSSAHDMHDGMSMPMDNPMNPDTQGTLLADKRESEFNHHRAGLLVLAAGIFIIAEGNIRTRRPLARQ